MKEYAKKTIALIEEQTIYTLGLSNDGEHTLKSSFRNWWMKRKISLDSNAVYFRNIIQELAALEEV